MRTTLHIADDVLLAAKDAAHRNQCSVGAIISELARRTLAATPKSSHSQYREPRHLGLAKLGIEPLPLRGGVVTKSSSIDCAAMPVAEAVAGGCRSICNGTWNPLDASNRATRAHYAAICKRLPKQPAAS